jgi:hypothetical protein
MITSGFGVKGRDVMEMLSSQERLVPSIKGAKLSEADSGFPEIDIIGLQPKRDKRRER